MTIVAETVTVWADSNGVPERMLWEGTCYQVTDTPTRLELDLDAVTHLAILPTGWRFQGTNETGDCLVFDVVSVDGQSWRVLNTYR
jgi:hypothetical protein